jgi:uncharacterized membrane protein
MATCKNCGADVAPGSKFCMNCGQLQEAPPAAPAEPAQQVPAGAPTAPTQDTPRPQYQQPQYQQYQYQQQGQDYARQQYHQNYQAGYQGNQNQGYQQPPQYQPMKPAICGIGEIYRRALNVLRRKPIRLWGLSLMYALLVGIVTLACLLVPVVSVPVTLVLGVGMTAIYLDGYRGKEVNSDQLFLGFKRFWRMAGGMAWMELWILIWGLIPIVGIVFAIIKAYSYRFVPYILLTDPDVTATEALRVSMRMTKGYRGKMFGADILIVVIIWVVMLVLYLLGLIPYAGILFLIINFLFTLAVVIFLPLLQGLISAAFYDEIERVSK